MERAAHHGLKAPRVFPKRSHKGKKLTSVAMEVAGVHYYLEVSEALSLANRLVDNAEIVQAWQEKNE